MKYSDYVEASAILWKKHQIPVGTTCTRLLINGGRKVATQAKIYLFKFNNRNSRKTCEICSKLAITATENDAVLVSLLPALNRFHTFQCFYCWLWTGKYLLWHKLLKKSKFASWLIWKWKQDGCYFLGARNLMLTLAFPQQKLSLIRVIVCSKYVLTSWINCTKCYGDTNKKGFLY